MRQLWFTERASRGLPDGSFLGRTAEAPSFALTVNPARVLCGTARDSGEHRWLEGNAASAGRIASAALRPLAARHGRLRQRWRAQSGPLRRGCTAPPGLPPARARKRRGHHARDASAPTSREGQGRLSVQRRLDPVCSSACPRFCSPAACSSQWAGWCRALTAASCKRACWGGNRPLSGGSAPIVIWQPNSVAWPRDYGRSEGRPYFGSRAARRTPGPVGDALPLGSASGFQPTMARTQSRAWILSELIGKGRRALLPLGFFQIGSDAV